MPIQNVTLGKNVPDFKLKDQSGQVRNLYGVLPGGPVLLAFYPGDFTRVCTQQFCNYRDTMPLFQSFGLQVVGVSPNTPEDHEKFARQYDFQFLLLSDPSQALAKQFGCTSIFMFGGISRAVFVIGKSGAALYRYVEPTVLTRRKGNEFVTIIQGLRAKGQL